MKSFIYLCTAATFTFLAIAIALDPAKPSSSKTPTKRAHTQSSASRSASLIAAHKKESSSEVALPGQPSATLSAAQHTPIKEGLSLQQALTAFADAAASQPGLIDDPELVQRTISNLEIVAADEAQSQ